MDSQIEQTDNGVADNARTAANSITDINVVVDNNGNKTLSEPGPQIILSLFKKCYDRNPDKLFYPNGSIYPLGYKKYRLNFDTYVNFLLQDENNNAFFVIKTNDAPIGQGLTFKVYEGDLAVSIPSTAEKQKNKELQQIKSAIKTCEINEANLACGSYQNNAGFYTATIAEKKINTALLGKFMMPEVAKTYTRRFSRKTEDGKQQEFDETSKIYHCHYIEPFINKKTFASALKDGTLKEKTNDQLLNLTKDIFNELKSMHDKGYVHRDTHGNNIFITDDVQIWDFDRTRTIGCNDIEKDRLKCLSACQRDYFYQYGYQPYHDIYNPIFRSACLAEPLRKLYQQTKADKQKNGFNNFYLAFLALTNRANSLYDEYSKYHSDTQKLQQAISKASFKLQQYREQFNPDDVQALLDNIKINYQQFLQHKQQRDSYAQQFNLYCETVFAHDTMQELLSKAISDKQPEDLIASAEQKYDKAVKKSEQEQQKIETQQEPENIETKSCKELSNIIKANLPLSPPTYRAELKQKTDKVARPSSTGAGLSFGAMTGGFLGTPFSLPGIIIGMVIGAVIGALFSNFLTRLTTWALEMTFKPKLAQNQVMVHMQAWNNTMTHCLGKQQAKSAGLTYLQIQKQTTQGPQPSTTSTTAQSCFSHPSHAFAHHHIKEPWQSPALNLDQAGSHLSSQVKC